MKHTVKEINIICAVCRAFLCLIKRLWGLRVPYARLIIVICFTQSYHIASAQYVVSFEESCQDVNEAQVYEAFYLSFGVDSVIKIIGACPLTGVNVFVDSMCTVIDVIVRNNCKTVEEKVNKRLLRAMMLKNMTFHDCYESPLLFPPIKKEKADTIRIEDSRHLSDFFKNRIPINIFLSSAHFLDWLRKHHTDGISIEEDSLGCALSIANDYERLSDTYIRTSTRWLN